MNWYEPSKFTEIGIAGSAVDVEKMGAIPTGIDHQPAATGTDDQFLSKHMAKQELKNRAQRDAKPILPKRRKPGFHQMKTGQCLRVTEGIRTPDLWNHNPAL